MNRILAILASIGGFLTAVLYALRSRDKVKATEGERDRAKAAKNTSDKATEALVRGLTEEANENDSNPRDYDFRD